MIWQHCGRLNDHDEHPFTAVQKVIVDRCKCQDNPCTCRPTLIPKPRHERPRIRMMCPGKQIRSEEVSVTTEVSV